MGCFQRGTVIPQRAIPVALLVSLFLCTAADAAVRPEVRAELVRRAGESGLSAPQTEAILQRADRIDAAGLPVQVVIDRYLEGMARGVPLPRIEAVVDRLEDRLRESARRVDVVFPADPSAPAREMRRSLIDHCAFALSVGVPSDGLEEAMQLASRGKHGLGEGRAPVLAMGCLVAGGLEPAASLDLVRTAWAHGYRGSDLEQLGRELGSLGGAGQGPPPEVVRHVLDSIRSGADRERLFHHLEALCGGGSPGRGPHPPGTRPGEDPSEMHGPGGPPQDPGHMGPGGRPHPHPHPGR